MSIAALVLTMETPLGGLAMAGLSNHDWLERQVAQLTSQVIQIAPADPALERCLGSWLEQGMRSVLLVPADRPLLTAETLRLLIEHQPAPLIVLTAGDGAVAAGYADLGWLMEAGAKIAAPLDWGALAQVAAGQSLSAPRPAECLVVDSMPALAEAEAILRQRINQVWMQAGVRLVDPSTTYIDGTVTIGSGTVVLPQTHLWGHTTIGESCRLGPNTIVRDSQVGNRCVIEASVVEEAVMEDESDIGPFGHLRQRARLCRGAHMGNFGEMKNSSLGPNSKMGHFSYLGDTTVGKEVNIGAGTITCNYDGARKHRTIIEDGAFIGSDTMLVAPVEIGAGARIGAGSVVTHDIPAGAVAYGVPARVRRVVPLTEEEAVPSAGRAGEGEGDTSGPGK